MCFDLFRFNRVVDKGEKLCGKNNRSGQMLSSPYCILTVLGKDGTAASGSKEKKTAVIKDSLDPTWGETFKVYVVRTAVSYFYREVGKDVCGGVKVEVWDRHRVRSDKFMVYECWLEIKLLGTSDFEVCRHFDEFGRDIG